MRKLLQLGAMLLMSSAAVAQPPVVVVASDAPFKVVNFSDLNIGSERGQKQLVHRIRAAARDLCLENNIEAVEMKSARHTCYTTATSGGYQQMDSALAARASGATLAAASIIVRAR